jgi:hypothetical protein
MTDDIGSVTVTASVLKRNCHSVMKIHLKILVTVDFLPAL